MHNVLALISAHLFILLSAVIESTVVTSQMSVASNVCV